MSTIALIDLQAKIYNVLKNDHFVVQQGAGVYDHAPDNAAYPFFEIGDDQFNSWDSHTFDGFEVEMTIHTWTQGQGKRQCKELMSRLYELLHNTDLSLNSQKTVALRSGLNTIMLDPDGRTFHGVSRFNLILGGVRNGS